MLYLGGLLGLALAGLMVDAFSAGSDQMGDEDEAGDSDEWLHVPVDQDPDASPAAPAKPEASQTEPGETFDGAEDMDAVMGGPGHDVIRGGGGDDELCGGLGNDTIEGGDGNDWVQGDGAYGEGGDDVIYGGAGDDLLAGQGGDDLICGDGGEDILFGGEGNDTLFGGAGNDILAGNDGDDLLISTEGADDLDGGRGNDVLIGHDGPETVWMNGGEGNDTLMPGAHDFASGNDGADTFVLRQVSEGFPTIADFNADDDQIVLHLNEDVARDAQLALRQDDDGTWLLELNGSPVGRLLQSGGLQVQDVRIIPVRS